MKHLALFLAALATVAAAAGILPQGAGFLAAGTEIPELRGPGARHYSNGDGTITAVISARPEEETDLEQTAETFECPFATGHCTYNGSEYGKNDIGLVKVEREVILYPPQVTERVGWFRFDLASMPDSVTVTWARCRFIVTYFEMSMGLAFTCLEADPVPTGAQALYNAIYESEVCAVGNMPRAVDSFDLGPIAAAHIQRSLSRDWVAFGLVGFNYSNIVTKRGWIIGWNVNPREHAPQLRVVYEPPTGVTGPQSVPVLPAFSVSPNPTTGGIVRLTGKTGTLPFVSGPPASGKVSQCFPNQARLTLVDAAGRAVLFRPLVIEDRSVDMPLDVSGLSSGVYLVRLEAGDRSASARLVIR
ncbi:T9SS type A sorting domain-containing protein [candidate division WOR-3 bacterium]|nr:T9SS type A sorting domain-containing protein [candidate division WOR-3 bacterium]